MCAYIYVRTVHVRTTIHTPRSQSLTIDIFLKKTKKTTKNISLNTFKNCQSQMLPDVSNMHTKTLLLQGFHISKKVRCRNGHSQGLSNVITADKLTLKWVSVLPVRQCCHSFLSISCVRAVKCMGGDSL